MLLSINWKTTQKFIIGTKYINLSSEQFQSSLLREVQGCYSDYFNTLTFKCCSKISLPKTPQSTSIQSSQTDT
jgi:hypothetical protein